MTLEIVPYKPSARNYAHCLRKHMTLAEVLLWTRLNRKQMLGYDFDRQRAIREYIVDFYCKDLKLAIEIDGRSHDFKERMDEERQRSLETQGIRFLRFWDYEVKHDMTDVLRRIEKWILEHDAGTE